MPDNFLLNKIKETSDVLDLHESIIEKDYYVTQLIQALSDVENEYFRRINRETSPNLPASER